MTSVLELFSSHGSSLHTFPISGILGQPLEAYIFMGPIYYQKLKHMVLIFALVFMCKFVLCHLIYQYAVTEIGGPG
jgi:hypothetical protein